MSQDTLAKNELFASIESDKPYASYIKTILGKVAVTVWDNILDKPVSIILKGNPQKADEGSVVKVWSSKENVFFRRVNSRAFKKGLIKIYELPEQEEEDYGIAQATDDELRAILKAKFLGFLANINKIDSVGVLSRMIHLGNEMGNKEKYISAIESRISELQAPPEFPQKLEVEVQPRED